MEEGPTNIVQLLEKAASTDAGISIYPPGTAPTKCNRTTYNEFLQKAHSNAQSIHKIPGISKDCVILLHFDKHADNFDWFWAVTLAGYTPAVSTPLVNEPDQRKKHLLHLFDLLGDPIILTTEALTSEFLNLEQLRLRPIERLRKTNGFFDAEAYKTVNGSIHEPSNMSETPPAEQTAVLMLTSGSTGNAKAVCLRHDQIIRSIEGKCQHLGLTTNDTFLNWIGMDHVANLIEMHFHAMYLCAEQVHVQASDLLMEPLTFLHLVDKHRVSYAFSPNFFLASLKRAVSGIDTRMTNIDLDLSCLKILMCGGEANVVANLVAVAELLTQFGVEDGFLRPGFGMTETCAAAMYGQGCPSYEVERGLEFSTVGTCIPGIKMRIMKDEGGQISANKEADVGEIGNFQMSGPIVFREYYRNPTATKSSFTDDGWFMTGDKGYIDAQGNLNLTGRSKETIIINGVKYFPHELETAIEESFVPGATPSYTAVFPHRPQGSQTEELCVVYLPTYDPSDAKARTETAEGISQVCIMVASVRPYRIIPLPKRLLSKSALGKLSRAKIRAAFEEGAYREIEEENNNIIKSYRAAGMEVPATELEEKITDIFCEMFDLPRDDAWVGSSLYDFGVTSIELIAFKQRVQNKLALGKEIPVVMLMNNPNIRGMAQVLQMMNQGSRPYDPVVTLQSKGNKTPLWFVHPGTGEVLVYVGLVKYIIDRPLYALRARGFEDGEELFQNMSTLTETYHTHLKKTQPVGPYAIAGYSEGALVAYEIAKLLEANGDRVVFCGTLDTTPKISRSIDVFSKIDALAHLSYLIELTSKEHALSLLDTLRRGTLEEALTYFLELAPAGRLEELELDRPKLSRWVDVMHSLYRLLEGYEVTGEIETVDVFVARNSGLAEQAVWREEHLGHWKEFSRTPVEYYECDGTHHYMLTQANMPSFQRMLKKALKAKGI
ncbi:MAG: hypothetical protein Q9225_003775 [Loekoesia sp. 1 TL-2023]